MFDMEVPEEYNNKVREGEGALSNSLNGMEVFISSFSLALPLSLSLSPHSPSLPPSFMFSPFSLPSHLMSTVPRDCGIPTSMRQGRSA